jgi:integrase
MVASQVARLPPGTYTDPGQTGLQLRILNKKDGTTHRAWLLRFVFHGEESRILLGHPPLMSLDKARGEARRLRELAANGIDPRRAGQRRRMRETSTTANAPEHSIERLATDYLELYARKHKKRPEYDEAILRRDVLPQWAGRDARTIKPRDVIELLDRIVSRGAKVSANRTATLLGRMFKFAIHRDIVETTPVQLLMRPGGKEKRRKRVLSEGELRIFLIDPEACTRYGRLARVMLLLLLTGQRRGELAKARWEEIDFQSGTWAIPDVVAKNENEHVVPLSFWALEELKRLKVAAGGSPWVLPAADPSRPLEPKLLTRGVAKCLQRFRDRGIAGFTLHDLRRTCRTGLSRLKIQPHVAERVLNHVQPGIEGVYDRYEYLEEKREALDKWAAYLEGLKPSAS